MKLATTSQEIKQGLRSGSTPPKFGQTPAPRKGGIVKGKEKFYGMIITNPSELHTPEGREIIRRVNAENAAIRKSSK